MGRLVFQTRSSVCPECHRLVSADCVEGQQGVHLEKFCPEHGFCSTRIAADWAWLSGLQEFAAKTFLPNSRQTPMARGCPEDCGECPGHRQKAAFFLFEITNACDLNCPICLGDPHARGQFLSLAEMETMLATAVDYAGPDPYVTLGGGEPAVHPQLFDLVALFRRAGISNIWLYTNGRKVARDCRFANRLAEEGLCVVLQWDGFSDAVYRKLRGTALLKEKTRALENLRASGARLGLCPTVVAGVNDTELGRIFDLFVSDVSIGTLDVATMAYVGKGKDFEQGRERRMTAQDVLLAMEDQTGGAIRVDDFSPVSFSHPECLQIAYLLAVPEGGFIPLRRFLDSDDYKTLALNTPLLQLTEQTESVLHDVVNRLWAGAEDDSDVKRGLAALRHTIDTLFPKERALTDAQRKALSMDLVNVVFVHSYMDGWTFDVGRSKKCISRTVLPDGRLMPTCAYNVIHRRTDRSGPADREEHA